MLPSLHIKPLLTLGSGVTHLEESAIRCLPLVRAHRRPQSANVCMTEGARQNCSLSSWLRITRCNHPGNLRSPDHMGERFTAAPLKWEIKHPKLQVTSCYYASCDTFIPIHSLFFPIRLTRTTTTKNYLGSHITTKSIGGGWPNGPNPHVFNKRR